MYAAGLGSLIEVVNRFGSFFYGSLLGVFVLALGFKRVDRHRRLRRAACRDGGRGGRRASSGDQGISFLWHNPIGVIAVVVVGSLVSLMTSRRPARRGMKIAGCAIAAVLVLVAAAVAPGSRHATTWLSSAAGWSMDPGSRRGALTSPSRRAGSRPSARSRATRRARSHRCIRPDRGAGIHRRPYPCRRSRRAAAGRELRPDGRHHHRRRQLRQLGARRRRGAGEHQPDRARRSTSRR